MEARETLESDSMIWACLYLAAQAAAVSIVAGDAAADVRLNEPFAVAFDKSGNWYILEHKGQRIVRGAKDGKFAPLAGVDAAIGFKFNDPHGLVAARDGRTLYVADTLNNQVHRVDALDLSSGTVSTVAGNGMRGVPEDGAPAAESPLVDPRAVAAGSDGTVYILERNGNALRAVDKVGRIRTLIAPGQTAPPLKGPKHLCVDKAGNVIVVDTENHIIRRFNPRDGSLTTIAGTGAKGSAVDANDPLKTELSRPHGVTFSPSGDLYISDSDNHRILRITPR